MTAGLLGAAGLVPAAAGVILLSVPDPDAWPYGEFGQVYPLARGLPPVLVTVFAFGVLGESLTAAQYFGGIVVSLALGTLVFAGGPPRAGHGLGLAALAGVMIAAYTIIDGGGVRESGHALSYAAWRILLEGLLVIAASRVVVGAGFWRAARASALPGLSGGLVGVAAFATVLWAQSQAPLALVSALRECSLLFAGLISVLVFGERFTTTRLAATVAAIAGIVLMQVT